MSADALDWRLTHWHEYLDLHRDPELYALGVILAWRTNQDPNLGAYPSQATLAAALRVEDRKTVKRYTDELARRGAILVKLNDAPKEKGRRGPAGHRYLFPALLGDSIPGTTPQSVPGNPSSNTGHVPADRARHSTDEYRAQEGRIPGTTPRIPGMVTLGMHQERKKGL